MNPDELLLSISQQDPGAKFRRADLHIHSYGGSFDVEDDRMIPEAIVEACTAEGIEILSITDHNSISNVRRGLDCAKSRGILLLPGVELTTHEGHLLAYCPTYESLEIFMGKLNFSLDRQTCNHTILQCLDLLREVNGFGIAAHIDLPSGFEQKIAGYPPHKQDLICHSALLGLEISNAANYKWYSDDDDNNQRRGFCQARRAAISEESEHILARVISSDAHTLASLGRNAESRRKLTRIKVHDLSFEAVKVALMDSAARIRLEDLVPEEVPYLEGIYCEGGILDKLMLNLSKNLTCVIGGRGTGKSTLIECIRTACGRSNDKEIVDSTVWPDRIFLIYRDEFGGRHMLVKDKRNALTTLPRNSISLPIGIESYGQGDTAGTIQHCGTDPRILLSFLDDFIDVASLKDDDERLINDISKAGQEIERIEAEVSKLSEYETAKNQATSLLQKLIDNKVEAVVNYELALSKERSLRQNLDWTLRELIKTLNKTFSEDNVFEEVLSQKADDILIGKKQFANVQQLVKTFGEELKRKSDELRTNAEELSKSLEAELRAWEGSESQILDKVSAKKEELRKNGISLDIGQLRRATQSIADAESRIAKVEKEKTRLAAMRQTRTQLHDKRIAVRSRIFQLRRQFASEISDALNSTIDDMKITLRYSEASLAADYVEVLRTCFSLRTIRAEAIAQVITLPNLISAIRSRDSKTLATLKDKKGSPCFSEAEATEFIKIASGARILNKLLTCKFEDRANLTLSKVIKEADNTRVLQRDFANLSLGQQQAILLTILLHGKNRLPLIIDQPEDNLDSQFVYKTLVRNLRKIKESRQVIIVTHNANLAVLGDAELIVPLVSNGEQTKISDRGSIDGAKTKEKACTILEGGSRAFLKRQRIYMLN